MRPPFDLDLLPGDWLAVEGTQQGSDLVRELGRELPRRHALQGTQVEAVAARRHLKDVVFWLPETGRWAHVHLTYRAETDPRWPATVIVDDWSGLVHELT